MANLAIPVIKLRFGATVIASDGEAGSLAGVSVDPARRVVTALIVKIGRGPGGVDRALPPERVVRATAEEIEIALTREALLQTMPAPATGALLLTRATQVQLNGGAAGALSQVSVLLPAFALHRLATKRGLSGEILLDAATIRAISDTGRAITCTQAPDVTLIAYRPDGDLVDAVHDALWNYPRLRIDLRAVQIFVVDGEVWLQGFVSSALNKRLLTELLLGIPGLAAIHNDVVSDDELAVRIARALAKDPRTRGTRFGVYPTLGKVYLRGAVRSAEIAQFATQIAAGVSGTHEVAPQMAVTMATEYLPMLAPVTGNEDIIPGGD